MSQTKTPITESFLEKNGFKRDESAPRGVNRWMKQQKGYESYTMFVTFHNNLADYVFVRKTNFAHNGAITDTKVWDRAGRILVTSDLTDAEKELGIKLHNDK